MVAWEYPVQCNDLEPNNVGEHSLVKAINYYWIISLLVNGSLTFYVTCFGEPCGLLW